MQDTGRSCRSLGYDHQLRFQIKGVFAFFRLFFFKPHGEDGIRGQHRTVKMESPILAASLSSLESITRPALPLGRDVMK